MTGDGRTMYEPPAAGAWRTTGERREAMRVLGERIAEAAAYMDAAMHRLLRDLREFDGGHGWHAQGAASTAHWLAWRVGWTLATGREHVRVARALGELPRIDEALRLGRLSYSKVRAITRVATPATEEMLLNDALLTTAGQLETICRKFQLVRRLNRQAPAEVRERRTVTRRTLEDGMVRIEMTMRPDEAAIVWDAIEHEARRMKVPADVQDGEAQSPDGVVHRFDRVDGLLAMSQAALRGESPDRTPIEVVLTIPKAALVATGASEWREAREMRDEDEAREANGAREAEAEGHRRGGRDVSAEASGGAKVEEIVRGVEAVGCFRDGTCVSAETARRLACDAGVVELVEDGEGQPLSVGRRTRTIPAAIKRALLHRDGKCRFPGCENRLYLDGHHLRHWADGGETSLENTCLLCSRCHAYVHEHGYRVERVAGELAFFDERGRRVQAEPERPRGAHLGWQAIAAANRAAGIEITAATNVCGWDGDRVQYEMIVDGLWRQEARGSS